MYQIFVLKQLAEKKREKGEVMCVAFKNLEKGYDEVCREELW